jgi:hypothetical protein
MIVRLKNIIASVSVVRERLPDEILAVNAEQSRTKNNETAYGATRGIDGDNATTAHVPIDSDPVAWYRVKFDGLQCIEKVKCLWEDNFLTWSCNASGCGKCTGHSVCDNLTVIVSTEGASTAGLPSPTWCVHGDTLELQSNGSIQVQEITFTGKEVIGTSKLCIREIS